MMRFSTKTYVLYHNVIEAMGNRQLVVLGEALKWQRWMMVLATGGRSEAND